MGHNGGRNNYSNQGGRARGGYQQGFPQQQMPYSPNPGFRQLPPQAPRGNQGMPSPYQGQRPLATPTFQHSPHQVARSPSLANAHPIHPQNGQIPPGNQQMPQTPYGVQGYPAHLQQAQVNDQFHSASSDKQISPKQCAAVTAAELPFLTTSIPFALPNTLSPESGQFEQFLIKKQQYQYPPYDPQNGGFYSPYGVPANMSMGQYMPNSPHPPYPGHPIQYVPGQYGNQAPPPMSRSASGVSDRPGPNVQPHTPMTPAPNHQPSTSRSANSPAPTNSNFKVPPKHKSAAIQIRNPNDRTVVTFEKAPKSPATVPTSKSPANVSATPTPPPQTPAFQSESQHARTDSQSLKSGGGGADVALSFKEQVQKKIEEAEQRAKVDEATKNVKAKDGEEAQPVVTEESKIESKPVEASKVEEAPPKAEPIVPTIVGDIDADSPIVKPVQEAPKEEAPKEEAPKEDTAKEEPDQPEEEDMDSDEYWARIEAEELRKEQEQEEAYQKKKAAEREVAAKKEAEDAARQDEELKNAEREAEAAEEARTKRLESGVTDDTSDKQDLFKALKKSDHAFQATKTPPTIETPSGSGSATPVMESTATMGPPATRYGGTKQKPLPLKLETTKQVEQPQPSAALQSLRSARFLTAINDKTYPPAINSPNPALNSAAPMGKFRYDKGFLMQFQTVFVEKPSETWTEKVKETVGDTSDTPASARPGRGSGAMNARNPSNRGSVLPGTFGGGGSAFGSFTNRTLPPGTTSTQRYEASLPGGKGPPGGTLRYNPANGPSPFGGMGFGQPMSRTPSSTSMSGHPQSPRNSPSHRGSNRGSKAGKRDSDKEAKTMPLTAGLDLKPLEVAATGWKPHSVKAGTHVGPPPGGDGYLAPDIVQRKVKAALNKMTPTTFQKIADQILEIVAQSRKESDGRTLRQVIQLTFEKATDEAHWAAMYAQFCSKMLSFMTPEIKDETLPNDKNGQVISGVNLFRKYLLNRCQQDFEAGWKSKLPDKPEGESEEAVMLSDEYYTAAAAKRRGLGLVRFIGELFKLGMLTGRIMHMCVKRLVDFDGMPDEAEVESLTSLLRTIGEDLDTEGTARRGMDAYFARIQSMVDLEALPSRLRFMLMVYIYLVPLETFH